MTILLDCEIECQQLVRCAAESPIVKYLEMPSLMSLDQKYVDDMAFIDPLCVEYQSNSTMFSIAFRNRQLVAVLTVQNNICRHSNIRNDGNTLNM